MQMHHCPSLVVEGYLTPCLQHFCHLLSSANRGRSVKAQSLAALNRVLRALCGFLRLAFPVAMTATSDAGSTSQAPKTSMQSAPVGLGQVRGSGQLGGDLPATSRAARCAHRRYTVLAHSRCFWPTRQLAADFSFVHKESIKPNVPGPNFVQASGRVQGQAAGDLQEGKDSSCAEALRLLGILFDCWTECSPSELRSPQLEQVTALVAVLEASNLLLRGLIAAPLPTADASFSALTASEVKTDSGLVGLEQLAETVLHRVLPHFPACLPVVQPSPAVLELLAQYNLQASQLLVSFLPLHAFMLQQQRQHALEPVGERPMPQAKPHQGPAASLLASTQWLASLVYFYVGVLEQGILVLPPGTLQEEASTARRDSPAQRRDDRGAARVVPPSAHSMVLQGVGAAAGAVPPDVRHRMLSAVTEWADRLSPSSPTRDTCLRLMHTLMRAWLQGMPMSQLPYHPVAASL